MTLRSRTLMVLALTTALLVALLYLSSRSILIGSYLDLETQTAKQAVSLALNIIDSDLDELSRNAADYAFWDETYAFAANRDPEYVESSLGDSIFLTNRIDLVAVVDAQGEILVGKAYDEATGEVVPLPEGLEAYLPTLRDLPDAEAEQQGLANLPARPMLMVSRPILPTDLDAPPRGALIMGRNFDAGEMERIKALTRVDLQLAGLEEMPPSPSLDPQTIVVTARDDALVSGYTRLLDLKGEPFAALRADQSRTIYQQGEQALGYFVISLLVAGIASGGVFLLVMERLVLSRVERLGEQVRGIQQRGDLRMRLDVSEQDELGRLATDINSMLSSMEGAQRMLRRREREALTLLDSLPAYAFFKNVDGTYVTANQRFCQAVKMSREEIVGKSDYDLYPRDVAEMYRAADNHVMAVGEAMDVGEENKADGANEFIIATRKVPLKDDNGTVIGLIGLVFDVTERQRVAQELAVARDQALEALRLKSQLLANVSHDLRTPIGSILGYTEMIQEEVYGPVTDQQRKTLGRVILSTNQLSSLINNLLDQAQIEAGRLTLHITTFAPISLLEAVYNVSNLHAMTKGVTLSYEISPEVPPTLSGDVQRLHQILQNLVSNALKFTERGNVHMHIFCPDPGHWALQVSDTGAGIPQEAQEYIFDAFRQVDGTVTRKQSGVGLGLSIVKYIASLMGGFVALQSEFGKGSTFTVTLPIQVKHEGIQV